MKIGVKCYNYHGYDLRQKTSNNFMKLVASVLGETVNFSMKHK